MVAIVCAKVKSEKLRIFRPKNWTDFSRSANGSLYELRTLKASSKISLHSYEAILFNQINVMAQNGNI